MAQPLPGPELHHADLHRLKRNPYKMNNPCRGSALIFNYIKFDSKTKMGERAGSDYDATSLFRTFESLSFDTAVHHNKTSYEMLSIVKQVANLDHSECDAFAIAILSHGGEGFIYAYDETVHIETITNILKDSSLRGKPKLFFIQACRGENFDPGVVLDHGLKSDADLVDSDSDEEEEYIHKLPREADFLYYYSTVPGYYSWRNSREGSIFIRTLCGELQESDLATTELTMILARATYLITASFESTTRDRFTSGMKQCPQLVTTLRKPLYFTQRSGT